MVADTNDDTPQKRKIFGIRYEPSISTGTLLVLAGGAFQMLVFWGNVEHRLTQNEDDIKHQGEYIVERVQARAAIDLNVSTDLAKVHDQLNDLGLRVYKLEIEPKRK